MAFRSNRKQPRSSRRSNKRINRNPRRKYYKKVLKGRNLMLVNTSKPSLNIPINPKFLTKFTASFSGYVPITAAESGYFSVKLNSPFLPFATLQPFTGALNNVGVYVGSTSAALQPRGYSNLCSATMYNKFRVYASRIKITASPGGLIDQSLFTVTPITNATISGQSASLEQNVAFSKERIISSNSDQNRNTIIHYIDMQSLDGLTKEQLMADESKVGTFGVDPTDLSVWLIKYQSSTGTGYTTRLAFNCEVTYYTELFEMNYESMSVV